MAGYASFAPLPWLKTVVQERRLRLASFDRIAQGAPLA